MRQHKHKWVEEYDQAYHIRSTGFSYHEMTPVRRCTLCKKVVWDKNRDRVITKLTEDRQ